MNKKQWLRTAVSLALTGVFCLGLAACGSGQKETVGTENGKYSPTLEITMARYSSPAMEEALAKTENAETVENNRFNKLYEEELGIKIKYDWIVDSSQYSSKVDLSLTAGNIPDFLAVFASQAKQLYEADLIWDMTDIYEEYASDVAKEYMEIEGESFDAVTFDGKLMAIPSTWGSYESAQFLWIRKDWLDKLGLSEPQTIADVEAIAYAFTNNDPDGNGKKDTYGLGINKDFLSSRGSITGFLNAYGAYMDFWLEDGNGGLVYSDIQPEMKLALDKLHQFYADGVISPEFGTMGDSQLLTLITSGKIGMFYGQHWMSLDLQNCFNLDKNADWKCYNIVGNTAGKLPKQQLFAGTNNYWVASKKTGNPEAIMKMIDLVWNMQGKPQYAYYSSSEDAPEAWWFNPIQIQNPLVNIEEWQNVQDLKQGKEGDETDARWVQCKKYMEGDDDWWNVYTIYGAEDCSMVRLNRCIEENSFFKSGYYGGITEGMVRYGATLESTKTLAITEMIIEGVGNGKFEDFVKTWQTLGGNTVTKEVNEWYAER